MHAARPVADGHVEALAVASSGSSSVTPHNPNREARALVIVRARWWWLLPATLALAVVLWAVLAPAPVELPTEGAQRHGLDDARRAAIFWQIARWQAPWRAKAKAHFPSHPWSAEDDYHWNVRSHVDKVVAPQFKVAPSVVWAVYDEGVRGQWKLPPPPDSTALERLIGEAGPLTPTVVPLRPRKK